MNARMRSLLGEASKCFSNLSSPFTTEWLCEHDVTLDECSDLSEMIASAIKTYLDLPKEIRVTMGIKQVMDESDLSLAAKTNILAHMKLHSLEKCE